MNKYDTFAVGVGLMGLMEYGWCVWFINAMGLEMNVTGISSVALIAYACSREFLLRKVQKLQGVLRDRRVNGAILLLVIVGLTLACQPAYAADCSFETAVDAKVIRFAWPPAVGINVGFVDFEVGYSQPVSACGNATVNVLGGICLIPKVGDVLGPFCPAPDDPEPE